MLPRWTDVFGRRLCTGIASATLFIFCTACVPIHAFADSPSCSDFGLSDVIGTWASSGVARHTAAFITFEPSGMSAVEIKVIRNDAVNTFEQEQSCWKLDRELMWYAEMPVYVKMNQVPQTNFGADAV